MYKVYKNVDKCSKKKENQTNRRKKKKNLVTKKTRKVEGTSQNP